jgi:hypothetical protein
MDKWEKLKEKYECYQELVKLIAMSIGALGSLAAFIKSFLVTQTRELAIPLTNKLSLDMPGLLDRVNMRIQTHSFNWFSLIFIAAILYFAYMIFKPKKKNKKHV